MSGGWLRRSDILRLVRDRFRGDPQRRRSRRTELVRTPRGHGGAWCHHHRRLRLPAVRGFPWLMIFFCPREAALRFSAAPFSPTRYPRLHRIVILDFMNDVTRILIAIEGGDPQAAAGLLPLVYDELRRLAAGHMSNESPGHTLNATALVHEGYLRLLGDQRFESRGHFFAAAAEAMRRILVENARSKGRLKRGKGLVRLEWFDHASSLPGDPDLLLTIDELLLRLAEEDAVAAKVAQMHLLGGLSVEEAGDALGLSRASAYRNWKYARVRLREALEEDGSRGMR